MNQHQQNNRLRTDSKLSHWGLNALYWYQRFGLDYVVVKTQKLFSLHILASELIQFIITKKNRIKLTYYDKTHFDETKNKKLTTHR